jgi:branched-chain amino acid transport system ATP-binding protein
VLENVMAGALFAGPRRRSAGGPWTKLEFVELDRFADYSASDLSLANRKRLELAKSLAMEPGSTRASSPTPWVSFSRSPTWA